MRENQEGSMGWILHITNRIGIDIGYIMYASQDDVCCTNLYAAIEAC